MVVSSDKAQSSAVGCEMLPKHLKAGLDVTMKLSVSNSTTISSNFSSFLFYFELRYFRLLNKKRQESQEKDFSEVRPDDGGYQQETHPRSSNC